MYAIAKATRYKEGQILDEHPFQNLREMIANKEIEVNSYNILRSTIYDHYDQAKYAASIVTKYHNPVGFVVVWVKNKRKQKTL